MRNVLVSIVKVRISVRFMNEWMKCSDLKCIQKPKRSRLSLTDLKFRVSVVICTFSHFCIFICSYYQCPWLHIIAEMWRIKAVFFHGRAISMLHVLWNHSGYGSVNTQPITCTHAYIHCVSIKNIPDVFSYNSRKHWWIFIIFGRNVTEKASNHMLLYFSTSPN